MIRALSFIGLLFLTTGAAAPQQPKRVEKIDVDGRTYRVRIAGDVAKANGTAIWTNSEDPGYFIRARRAIEAVSGCVVKDSYTTSTALIATLDCSKAEIAH